MSYKVEYKSSAYSSWTTVGSSYTESDAYNSAERKKSQSPESLVRVVDTKTGAVMLAM